MRTLNASYVASLTEPERVTFLKSLTPDEQRLLKYHWPFWAREKQLPPKGWDFVWLLLAGRGFGKTRTCAEVTKTEVMSGRAGRAAFVARNPADARDVMVEGESGILSVSPPQFTPKYEPSKRRLTWPNGAIATIFTSYEPDQLRGPQFDFGWCEELAAWRYPQETWDNLMLALRLGSRPRCVAATTPKPIALLKKLVSQPNVVVTRGSTYENIANLTPAFFEQVVDRYRGTALARQEIEAEILEEAPGALWKRSLFQRKSPPDLVRIVVAVDPAASYGEESDETGIIVAGRGVDGVFYVLADRSCRLPPDGWARRAVHAYREFKADRIVGEANQGGDMVENTIRTVDRSIAYKKVFASRGKAVRAEPIAALYEQHKVWHVGELTELEDQLCNWEAGKEDSPDRLDALVWALSELSQGYGGVGLLEPREGMRELETR